MWEKKSQLFHLSSLSPQPHCSWGLHGQKLQTCNGSRPGLSSWRSLGKKEKALRERPSWEWESRWERKRVSAWDQAETTAVTDEILRSALLRSIVAGISPFLSPDMGFWFFFSSWIHCRRSGSMSPPVLLSFSLDTDCNRFFFSFLVFDFLWVRGGSVCVVEGAKLRGSLDFFVVVVALWVCRFGAFGHGGLKNNGAEVRESWGERELRFFFPH